MNSVRSVKEMRMLDIIDAGVATMVDFGKNDIMPHFIYCHGYYHDNEDFKSLKKIFLEKMREYGITSSLLTMLSMYRRNLITKEQSKEAAEGKLKIDHDWRGPNYEGSINDDLESFVNNLQNSEEIDYEDEIDYEEIDYEEVWSFFTPKLTKKELKLVEEKNDEHMMTYYLASNADVSVEEMKKSDSKDKYVQSECIRRTFYLTLES